MSVRAFRLACVALSGLLPLSAQALSVYRCTGADGAITFQDQPCKSNEQSRVIELQDPAEPVAGAMPSTARAGPAPAEMPETQNAAPLAPGRLPSGFVCTREDGSRYLSDDGRGDRRAVPLAMLGLPSQSLAEAYGGANGIGVSAPGLRSAPTDSSGRAAAGNLYTWVEDPCERISGGAYCRFLDTRISDAERRLRLAFSDSAPRIRAELEDLKRRAADCHD